MQVPDFFFGILNFATKQGVNIPNNKILFDVIGLKFCIHYHSASVRCCSCILHWFAVGGTNGRRKDSQISGVECGCVCSEFIQSVEQVVFDRFPHRGSPFPFYGPRERMVYTK